MPAHQMEPALLMLMTRQDVAALLPVDTKNKITTLQAKDRVHS